MVYENEYANGNDELHELQGFLDGDIDEEVNIVYHRNADGKMVLLEVNDDE